MAGAYGLFRELRPYSLGDVASELGASPQDAEGAVGDLLSCGIMRYRTGDETDEGERADEEDATDDQRLQFRFVGIAIARGLVFVCYPKYIRRGEPTEGELRQCLRVIRKLDREGVLPILEDAGQRSDRLAVIVRLLQLYDECGVYTNFEESRELNGNGVIDWQRTVDTLTPVLSHGRPIYLDVWTRKTRRDDFDFVTRLHRAILTECSCFLEDCGLAGLLGISGVELTGETPADFGDPDVLNWRLERERATQFVTWKQEAIDLMRAYLDGGGIAVDGGETLRLGTTSYYHAWELACKAAFGDLLDTRLLNLPIKLDDRWRSRGNKTLIQIIPRPLWERPDGEGGFVPCRDVGTLIPDTVTFVDRADGTSAFCILDAKYYVPEIEAGGSIKRQPGLESVTKQFLYQSAYRNFVVQNGFDAIVNTFLVPTEGAKPRLLARVSFPDVMASLTGEISQFTDHIDMWAIPADEVFDCYLEGRKMTSYAPSAPMCRTRLHPQVAKPRPAHGA